MSMEIITKTPKETQRAAKVFAKEILALKKNSKTKALVVALEGELGAGKTTFIQGFVAGFGIKEEISSPTFLIMKKVDLHKHQIKCQRSNVKCAFKNLYHLDCYRLKDEKDLIDLGVEEIFADKENIVLIEWAKKIKKILPKNAINIKFEYRGLKERSIKIKNSITG